MFLQFAQKKMKHAKRYFCLWLQCYFHVIESEGGISCNICSSVYESGTAFHWQFLKAFLHLAQWGEREIWRGIPRNLLGPWFWRSPLLVCMDPCGISDHNLRGKYPHWLRIVLETSAAVTESFWGSTLAINDYQQQRVKSVMLLRWDTCKELSFYCSFLLGKKIFSGSFS